jgi:acetyl esterase/lipase
MSKQRFDLGGAALSRRSFIGLIAFATFSLGGLVTAAAERPQQEFPLWPQGAPGALGKAETDVPTLTPYWAPADRATGAVMIVCPGGGYSVLAAHEGVAYAHWLNDLGITAFVLKYRLCKNGYYLPTILLDAARAVRVVRTNAPDWKLDPQRVGIMGSSAGGHLSATLMTRFDAGKTDAADPVDHASSRPDLVVFCYAFILFDRADKSDRQTRFLGKDFTPEQVRQFSPALNVTKDAPPCFIWQTVEDTSVVPENAHVIADALRQAGVPYDLHLYQKGRHGIGLGNKEFDRAKLHPWTSDCAFWFKEQGFLTAK